MWVDFPDIDSTITTTKSTTEPTQMSTSKSPTIQTEVSFTGNDFNTSQRTSLEKEVLLTNETPNNNHGTTLGTDVSSTNQSSRGVNSSQITTVTSLSGEKELKVKSSKHLYYSLLTKQVYFGDEDNKLMAFLQRLFHLHYLRLLCPRGLL